MRLSTYFWPFYAYRLTPLRPSEKPSLLLSLYFHVVLQHLKTYIQTNVRFKGVVRYMTFEFPGFCVTRHLTDGQERSYVEILVSKHSLSQNKYYFFVLGFSREEFTRLRAVSLFFLVRRAKRPRHANDLARSNTKEER